MKKKIYKLTESQLKLYLEGINVEEEVTFYEFENKINEFIKSFIANPLNKEIEFDFFTTNYGLSKKDLIKLLEKEAILVRQIIPDNDVLDKSKVKYKVPTLNLYAKEKKLFKDLRKKSEALVESVINEEETTGRDIERERRIYPNMFRDENLTVKEQLYDKLMDQIALDQEKYKLILCILEYMNIYNKKVGISKNIKYTNIKSISNLNTYNLKTIRHKWMKLAENPNIPVEDLYKDFDPNKIEEGKNYPFTTRISFDDRIYITRNKKSIPMSQGAIDNVVKYHPIDEEEEIELKDVYTLDKKGNKTGFVGDIRLANVTESTWADENTPEAKRNRFVWDVKESLTGHFGTSNVKGGDKAIMRAVGNIYDEAMKTTEYGINYRKNNSSEYKSSIFTIAKLLDTNDVDLIYDIINNEFNDPTDYDEDKQITEAFLNKLFTNNLIKEDLSKTDVRDEIEKYLKTNNFIDLVRKEVISQLGKSKEVEDKMVEISSNVLVQLYKSLWTKRGFWKSDLKNSPS